MSFIRLDIKKYRLERRFADCCSDCRKREGFPSIELPSLFTDAGKALKLQLFCVFCSLFHNLDRVCSRNLFALSMLTVILSEAKNLGT